MRIALGAIAFCLLAGCASPHIGSADTSAAVSGIACTDPRPQVCTMQYDPVCATLADGSRQDKSSPCNACAFDSVVSYERGQCAQ